jgi:cell division protein FtsL
MKNILILALVIIVIILLVFTITTRNQEKKLQQKIKEAQDSISSLEHEAAQLTTQIQLLEKINADYKQKYAELEKQKAVIDVALKESETRLEQIEAQIVAMPVCDLVLNIQDIIGDTGVTQTEAGMIFTYEASQKPAARLFQWREFSLVKIPKLEEKIKIQEGQITNLGFQISTWEAKEKIWKKQNSIWLQEKTIMNDLIIDYGKKLSAQKKKSKLTSALVFLAGIGGGLLIGK